MKKWIGILSLALLLTAGISTGAGETPTPPPVPAAGEENSDSHWDHMLRGVTNIGTCFLEVPRCMLYQSSRVPFWGFVYGSIEGVCLTPLRAFGGVTDVLFLGYDPGLIYTDTFCDYVWESRWLYEEN
ncbi:hypothetical protein [Victivallis sp. Marseille-Q1083]|uniref:hypothetical protein n=1 Tax=Victivallis sp. Marseille-Q1083 TaxID=2717288 RepID=UPI00158E53F0|nr:hypothetical protein [Victivallis sp. Marseille-Q1083]